jgi:hypothetical protein
MRRPSRRTICAVIVIAVALVVGGAVGSLAFLVTRSLVQAATQGLVAALIAISSTAGFLQLLLGQSS